ncbi:MAG: HAD family hydrolase [Spirochaetaceae bacterium]|jgi:putative hydrolase of the HAD superfamily|nr:HAD family hydrolase [Spirochaetaceae bacterium]
MTGRFDGVAFDLDGTLYPNYRLYIRLIPFMCREHRLLRALGKARNILRAQARAQTLATEEGFYTLQARLMGQILRQDPQVVQQRVETLIYRGWEPLFKEIALFPQVRETLIALRDRGIKLGLLSDFPPVVKLEHLRLTGLWDQVLCSEEVGQLKPDRTPFLALARQLDLPAARILYVGNSVAYDIIGAKNAGMKAALIAPPFACLPRLRRPGAHNGRADFVYGHYRQLYDYVVG